jgi:hypothetical protein
MVDILSIMNPMQEKEEPCQFQDFDVQVLKDNKILSLEIQSSPIRHRMGWHLSQAANIPGAEESFPNEILDVSGQLPYCLPAAPAGDRSALQKLRSIA